MKIERFVLKRSNQYSQDKKFSFFSFWNKNTIKKIIGKSFHSSMGWGSKMSDVNTTVYTDLDSVLRIFDWTESSTIKITRPPVYQYQHAHGLIIIR